jgi:hypothetical protein
VPLTRRLIKAPSPREPSLNGIFWSENTLINGFIVLHQSYEAAQSAEIWTFSEAPRGSRRSLLPLRRTVSRLNSQFGHCVRHTTAARSALRTAQRTTNPRNGAHVRSTPLHRCNSDLDAGADDHGRESWTLHGRLSSEWAPRIVPRPLQTQAAVTEHPRAHQGSVERRTRRDAHPEKLTGKSRQSGTFFVATGLQSWSFSPVTVVKKCRQSSNLGQRRTVLTEPPPRALRRVAHGR